MPEVREDVADYLAAGFALSTVAFTSTALEPTSFATFSERFLASSPCTQCLAARVNALSQEKGRCLTIAAAPLKSARHGFTLASAKSNHSSGREKCP